MFKVIITGGKEFEDYGLLKRKCDYYLNNKIKNDDVIVVSGGEEGADMLGEKYAAERGLAVERYVPNWDRDGKSAGYKRNNIMADTGDACIAFMSSYGKNTIAKNIVSVARNKKLLVREVNEY